jgi:hypothetical protein
VIAEWRLQSSDSVGVFHVRDDVQGPMVAEHEGRTMPRSIRCAACGHYRDVPNGRLPVTGGERRKTKTEEPKNSKATDFKHEATEGPEGIEAAPAAPDTMVVPRFARPEAAHGRRTTVSCLHVGERAPFLFGRFVASFADPCPSEQPW